MANWMRPENVPFPSVWRTFSRQAANGCERKYWIQDLTPEYEAIFLDKMRAVYIEDEPLNKYSKVYEDPQGVNDYEDYWKKDMKQKLGLICLTKDENGPIQYVGGNLTYASGKNRTVDITDNGSTFMKILGTALYIKKLKDVFKELQVNEYLAGSGLYVLPEFRGQGIATEILKARRELCLAMGLKASGTIFTSTVSQKNAQLAGFTDFVEISYDDLEKINPEWSFPGITSCAKSAKFMIKKYV